MSLSNKTLALRKMVAPALHFGKCSYSSCVPIGQRFGGTLIADVMVSRGELEIPVLFKWQDEGRGKAEAQIPFDVICLADAVKAGRYAKAYVVLGGEGWMQRDFFTEGGLSEYLKDINGVRIVTLLDFVSLAQKGTL